MSLITKTRQLTTLLALVISTIAILSLVSCGGNSLSSPNTDLNGEDINQLSPGPGDITANPRTTIGDKKPPALSVLPQGDVSTESIQDLATAMYLLREKGGGITSIVSLTDTEFAIHIWDKKTGTILPAMVAVTCSNNAATILDVNGWAIIDGAAFPLNVTVRVPGYALESYVYTSGNVLSFPMSPMIAEKTSTVFGIADNHGFGNVEFYTDGLFPRQIIGHPSLANPNFCQFNIPFSSDRVHGFSAFLTGNVDIDELGGPGPMPNPGLIPFVMNAEINWEVAPLAPGMQRFIQLGFDKNINPSGIAHGVSSLPTKYWLDGTILVNSSVTATPTAVFITNERYVPIGPSRSMIGGDPQNLTFNCPYFDPPVEADRVVMAGQMIQANDAMDVVHQDWHPGTNPDAISFSGCPVFEVANGADANLPVFAWIDPLGDEGDFIQVESRIGNVTVWNLTGPSLGRGFNTVNLAIPPEWVGSIVSEGTPEYRMESLQTLSQTIDSFNRHDIIRDRTEACYSPWCQEIE